MGKYNTNQTEPRLFRGKLLPDGRYTIELTDHGMWNPTLKQFVTGAIGTSTNGNLQFTLNWKIVEGKSHVGLYLRDRWTLTENTFADLLGKVEFLSGGVPTIDTDDDEMVMSILMSHIKIGTQIIAFCGADERGVPVVKNYVTKK